MKRFQISTTPSSDALATNAPGMRDVVAGTGAAVSPTVIESFFTADVA